MLRCVAQSVMRSAFAFGLVVFSMSGTARAVNWDAAYEGNVTPSAATPAWTSAGSGLSEILGGDVLHLTDPRSWDINNDPVMMTNTSTFQYNDPNAAGESWVIRTGRAFTIEWRMRINVAAAGKTPSDGEIGVKLEYMGGYPNNQHVKFEWYYDVTGQQLVNNRYKTSFVHNGWTGAEGAESTLAIDAFPNVAVGEWHTYRLTSAVVGTNSYLRELWLDGQYVGRWTDDTWDTGSGAQVKMRANKDLSPSSDVEFDYMRWADEPEGRFIRPMPVLPQTLLVNQSFDAAAGPGQGWLGDYGTTNVDLPTPSLLDGTNTWGRSHGDPAAPFQPRTWQTVAIVPGDTVTLNGFLFATTTGTAATATVTLHDGSLEGTVIGSTTVDPSSPETNGNWTEFALSGVANSGRVTVAIEGNLAVSAWGQASAIYADGFTLTASSPCTLAPGLDSVVPDTADHDADLSVLISGSNLLTVGEVFLINYPTSTVIPGTVTSSSDTQMGVDFATAGAPLGSYTLVASAPSCLAAQRVGAVTVACRNPTSITGTVPETITPPSGVLELTILGTNLEGLLLPGSSLKMINGETVLEGINLQMSGSDLKATFDLTGAPVGFYKLVPVRGDACPDPQAIYVRYLQPIGDNLLQNPGFETGQLSPWVGGNVRSGDYFGAKAHSGTYFTGQAGNGTQSEKVSEQTVVVPPGDRDLMLMLWAWVWDTDTPIGRDSRVTGEIVMNDEVVASTTFSSLDSVMSTWIPMFASWSGNISTQVVKVRVTVRADGAGSSGWGVAAADDIVLGEAYNPACHDVWADADGDGDVDQVDFGVFQACITEGLPWMPTLSNSCRCFDRVRDGRIDDQDLPLFVNCAQGPGIQVDPACP